MGIDASELLARVCALEEEALLSLPAPIPSNAFPRWLFQSETLPYFRNRIVSFQLDTSFSNDDGQEMDVYQYTVGAALMLAPYSAGYNGESDEQILAIIPQLVEYVDARELLQSNAFPEPMNFLRYSHFVAGSGYETFPLSASGDVAIGCSFTFLCMFDKLINQFY